MTDEEHRWAVSAAGLLFWEDPPDDGGRASATAGTYRRARRVARETPGPVGARLAGAYRSARRLAVSPPVSEIDWRRIA